MEVEVEAPKGSKVLVMIPPLNANYVTPKYCDELTTMARKAFRRAEDEDDWPVVLVLRDGWSVRWLEAER